MNVNEKTAKLTSAHGGQVFYFCSVECKEAFEGDPHKYGHPH